MTPERKVVVITGASRGIGAQLSKAYRHIGYQVIASSRSMRKSDDPAILVIESDITRPETAERIRRGRDRRWTRNRPCIRSRCLGSADWDRLSAVSGGRDVSAASRRRATCART